MIPSGWEAHHQPVAEGAMTAACVITRPASGSGPATFDSVAGRSTYPTPATVYTGPCRLQRANLAAHPDQIGEKATTIGRYRLGLPLSAARPNVNDLVEMTDATDAVLVGQRLRITDVPVGSLVWERDVMCEQWEPTTR